MTDAEFYTILWRALVMIIRAFARWKGFGEVFFSDKAATDCKPLAIDSADVKDVVNKQYS